MLDVRIAGFGCRIVVDVDDIIQHPNRCRYSRFQQLEVQLAIANVLPQVHTSQIAHCRLRLAGVQQYLSAEIATMNHSSVVLRRTDVRRIFERYPWMSGFKQTR